MFEDDAMIVLDKPAGLCTIPPRNAAEPSLRGLVESHLGAKAWTVHRLDRDTSGVVVMAKSAAAHRALNAAFERRQVAKVYVALVAGSPPADRGIIEIALARGRKGRTRPARPDEDGLAARTRYEVLDRLGAGVARVRFEPESGRQHQIRVHASAQGFPILGDRLYAPPEVRDRAPRLMLHALSLKFRHATDGRDCTFTAPPPSDFASLCQRLAST